MAVKRLFSLCPEVFGLGVFFKALLHGVLQGFTKELKNMKVFKVSDFADENDVTLEVDETKLTVVRATEINNFRGDSRHRIMAQAGVVEEAVIRMFGADMIGLMLADNGASFGRSNPVGDLFSKELHEQEGWGGVDGTPHGWCGIRVVGANVNVPGFDEVFLVEVPQ